MLQVVRAVQMLQVLQVVHGFEPGEYGSGSFFEGLADRTINDNFTLKFKIFAKKNDS